MKKKEPSSLNGLLKWLPGIIISVVVIFILSRLVDVNELEKELFSIRKEIELNILIKKLS